MNKNLQLAAAAEMGYEPVQKHKVNYENGMFFYNKHFCVELNVQGHGW